MENNAKNKRDIIKNILILFLAAMLILTFFSNTIMNRSLPEVSTQYTQYKQISDRIRASATVTANQDYKIVADATREIAEVYIRRGDRIERGQVILSLVENESSALVEAEQALAQLMIQRQQMVIDNSGSSKEDYAYEISLKKNEIADIKAEIESQKALEASINEKVNVENMSEDVYEKQLEAYDAQTEAMQESLDETNEKLDEITGKMQRYESTYDTLDEIKAELESSRSVFEGANAVYLEAKAAYDVKKAEIDKLEDEIELLEKDNEEYDELIAESTKIKNELEEELSEIDQNNSTVTSLEMELAKARSELYSINREYNYFKEMKNAKSELDRIEASPDATDAEKAEAERLYNEAKSTYDDITGGVTRTEGQYLDLIDTLELAVLEAEANYDDATTTNKSASSYKNKIDDYKRHIAYNEGKKNDNTKKITEIKKQIADLEENMVDLTESKNEAEAEKNGAEKELESGESKLEYATLRDQADEIRADIKQKNKELDTKKKEIEKFKSNYAKLIENGERAKELRTKLTQAEREFTLLEEKQSIAELNAPYSEQIKALQLQNMDKSISQKQKEIERIKTQLVSNEMTSPVSGTVTSVSYTAGEEFAAGETIATVAISEKGYTMEIPLTNEQSQRIKIGDRAELQNYYYGVKPEIVVSAFKNDPSNPGRGKIAVLSVTGEDITAGQNLNITLGDRAKSYDKVVPNSAVREDSNGKFVLIVESKSTPLGNRYIARRVDVTVVASDETSSALSGELLGGEFVITTASSPISDGMQVRLADKN